MLWADIFTDSEYIGFVDTDTMISSAVNPYDLFDENGKPWVIVQAAGNYKNQIPAFNEASVHAFKRETRFWRLYGMAYFPLILKREHFAKLCEHLLAKHTEYSFFDDIFTAHIFCGIDKEGPIKICQFCLMAEFLFQVHRAEYWWHFETESQIEFATQEMHEPFPKIAVHVSYVFQNFDIQKILNTVVGRRNVASRMTRKGYCHSLVSWSSNDRNYRRCKKYISKTDEYLHAARGAWRFEQFNSLWLKHP